eukprot:1391710-Amorphochlora_amoeboformis.AAC.1
MPFELVIASNTDVIVTLPPSPLSAANTNHQLHHISLNLLSVIHASSIYQPPSSRSPFSPQALWVGALAITKFVKHLFPSRSQPSSN